MPSDASRRGQAPCAEFPNDNPALHDGAIWRCEGVRQAPSSEPPAALVPTQPSRAMPPVLESSSSLRPPALEGSSSLLRPPLEGSSSPLPPEGLLADPWRAPSFPPTSAARERDPVVVGPRSATLDGGPEPRELSFARFAGDDAVNEASDEGDGNGDAIEIVDELPCDGAVDEADGFTLPYAAPFYGERDSQRGSQRPTVPEGLSPESFGADDGARVERAPNQSGTHAIAARVAEADTDADADADADANEAAAIPEVDDPFARLVRELEETARAHGAPSPTIACLRALFGVTGSDALPTLDAQSAEALLAAGLIVEDLDGGESPRRRTRARPFAEEAAAWRGILRGESDDFSGCGATPLDEWAANVLARVLGTPARAETIRRDLRGRGIAAFGLVAAAA